MNFPVLRPDYPSHHVHSIHPVTQPLHSRPIEHYPVERQPKCPPPYPEMYPMYDAYQHPRYEHPRYEREQRPPRYDKRQEYAKDYPRQHPEVIAHRIPGYIGDRSREYKPRYRQVREPRKEIIRELPQVSEQEMRVIHSKEILEEPPLKKKEEKTVVKHKKHHHHHKSKDAKKQDSKTSVSSSVERQSESSKNLIRVDVHSDKMIESKSNVEIVTKTPKIPEKLKEKKHKHKKHKNGDQPVKKKKSTKKEKTEILQSSDAEGQKKLKTKKKKNKLKPVEVLQDNEVEAKLITESDITKTETDEANLDTQPQEENVEKTHDTSLDTLDIFADEGETAILASDVIPEADSNEVESTHLENEENVVDNIQNDVHSDEEIEENSEETGLQVDVPALSKWEREEFEDDVESRPQRRSAVVVPKEEKGALPSDIIQRAELAILSKPLKPQIASKDKSDSKDSSAASSPDVASPQKEPELKSVVKSERLPSPALQVTISTTKEKRSVHSRKDEKSSKVSSQNQQSKRIKLDRSKLHESSTHRAVSSNAKTSDRVREIRDRNNERHERKRSPTRDSNKRTDSRDRRERDNNIRRIEKEKENRYNDERLREERWHRFSSDKHAHSSREYSSMHENNRSERRRHMIESSSQSRSSRNYNRENVQTFEKSHRTEYVKRSRSRSYESIESHNSSKRKQHVKQREEQESHYRRSNKEHFQSEVAENKTKRKHSPIKPPEKQATEAERVKKQTRRDFHDDLKFEPDYDAYSDTEEKESRERLKRSASPEVARKKPRIEKMVTEPIAKSFHKTEKSSVTSSDSSSANSESDSSDSDDPKSSKSKVSDSDHKQKHKKSKHKKHKKHKHKHKKKKSHKRRE